MTAGQDNTIPEFLGSDEGKCSRHVRIGSYCEHATGGILF